MTHLVRYELDGAVRTGVQEDDRLHPLDRTLAELLRLPLADLRRTLDEATAGAPVPSGHARTLAPVEGRMEVWAAGVTYRRSREARMTESATAADVYERVYDAPRPELFFKSAAWRVVGDGGTIAVRDDSEVDVPEPELAVVVNAHGEIVGYTVCDDVSSRTIEGENPLYLPQAKVFLGGCAVGPAIRPAWQVPDPYALGIRMTIRRDGEVAWSGETGTDQLHRRLDDLVDHLFRADVFPDGAVLATGTCLVPDLPFTLAAGDTVEIAIDEVGVLATRVVRGLRPLLDTMKESM
ncbi:fumarylacetoacetate hydrolase family protein [Actinomadura xylanilytica]|uniref:fumarylacetoacetate hydrolase family protein n=1 Tax=Actinomadura xylanilytica TaxID=887459 RepID=UPI00255A81EC|nr:fumarylacetoacetate hydrolase family protein [Actinomadura xylanilytica]MDL4773000.1 fumarylacetoacetate hydrolase family protein [Actinomadura xylanilytica]